MKFNDAFFYILVIMALTCYIVYHSSNQALDIIKENHYQYKLISQEQEYQFNQLDFSRLKIISLLIGILMTVIAVMYLVFSFIDYIFDKKKEVHRK